MLKFAHRLWTEVDHRLLWLFMKNFCFKGARAVKSFEKRKKQGKNFPAFMVISLTNQCNFSCKGCWVSTQRPTVEIPPEKLNNIIEECKRNGSYFFGLLGGETLLYKDLFAVMAKHPDCYFQIFTNGSLLTRDVARQMKELGNVTPIISIEGNEVVSDIRRGRENVYERSIKALDHCAEYKLLTGVATSACQNNFDTLVTQEFIDELVKRKVHYLWYYIYRPVGPHPTRELALTAEQIIKLRQFIVDKRCTAPLALVDAYWDGDGGALCPAATGFSHHINMFGDIEFCPPLQFSMDNVQGDGSELTDLMEKSQFMQRFRDFVAKDTQGCILLKDPKKLEQFLRAEGARDSSGRGTAYAELEKMSPCPCHHQAGAPIPEKSWMYQIAKKYFFFGFGAYG